MELLIIEKDATQAEIYELAFGDEFTLHVVDCMKSAIDVLEAHDIKIVISDWQIGEYKASVFCENMDIHHVLSLPVVVVVSDNEDDETIREAFATGVSHYITKPYNILSFTETVMSIKGQIERLSRIEQDNASTQAVAKTALSQAAIYGNGMEIVASLNNCNDLEAMSRVVLSTLKANGVHAAIQYRDSEVTTSYDTNLELCDETTERVFTVLHAEGRIYRFGRRLMLNDGNVSLLVKHVAGDDPVLHDAILDMGAKLVPAINARYLSYLQQQALVQTQVNVDDVTQKLRATVVDLESEKQRIVESVSKRIEESFHQLAMTEEQEAFFMKLIDKELSHDTDNTSIASIDALLIEMSERLSQRIKPRAPVQENEPTSDYVDVELF